MATLDDVRRLALAMPEAEESTSYGWTTWVVRGKLFVWERPLGKKDRADLGDTAPDEPIFAARVADEGVKDALVADDPDVFFTIPHFKGYSAVLFQLERISVDVLKEVIADAWLSRAPKKLAATYDPDT
jgi:hypothetical protein